MMKKEEMIEAVSEAAFVEKDECERVLISFKNVFTKEVKKKVTEYLMIAGGVVAFLGLFAALFYFLGKSDKDK